MDNGNLSYNDVLQNYQSTINLLMRPIKRKKIIKNVLTETQENR